jgi:hypothetical protein
LTRINDRGRQTSFEGLYVEDLLGEQAPAPHRAKALQLWKAVMDRVRSTPPGLGIEGSP